VEWYYLRVLDINQVNGRSAGDLVSLLEKMPATTNSAVLEEKLADLYFTQGKPTSAIYAGRQALALDPSPQQRVRLRLRLGERMLSQGQDLEAYENYQALINEFPAFADKPEIYKKLLVLAQKLNKKSDAEKFEEELKR